MLQRAQLSVKFFLGLAELKILPAAPADTCPRTSLISFCTVQPRTLWQFSVSLRPLVQALESYPASGATWFSSMPPSLERGWVININSNRFRPYLIFSGESNFIKQCLLIMRTFKNGIKIHSVILVLHNYVYSIL